MLFETCFDSSNLTTPSTTTEENISTSCNAYQQHDDEPAQTKTEAAVRIIGSCDDNNNSSTAAGGGRVKLRGSQFVTTQQPPSTLNSRIVVRDCDADVDEEEDDENETDTQQLIQPNTVNLKTTTKKRHSPFIDHRQNSSNDQQIMMIKANMSKQPHCNSAAATNDGADKKDEPLKQIYTLSDNAADVWRSADDDALSVNNKTDAVDDEERRAVSQQTREDDCDQQPSSHDHDQQHREEEGEVQTVNGQTNHKINFSTTSLHNNNKSSTAVNYSPLAKNLVALRAINNSTTNDSPASSRHSTRSSTSCASATVSNNSSAFTSSTATLASQQSCAGSSPSIISTTTTRRSEVSSPSSVSSSSIVPTTASASKKINLHEINSATQHNTGNTNQRSTFPLSSSLSTTQLPSADFVQKNHELPRPSQQQCSRQKIRCLYETAFVGASSTPTTTVHYPTITDFIDNVIIPSASQNHIAKKQLDEGEYELISGNDNLVVREQLPICDTIRQQVLLDGPPPSSTASVLPKPLGTVNGHATAKVRESARQMQKAVRTSNSQQPQQQPVQRFASANGHRQRSSYAEAVLTERNDSRQQWPKQQQRQVSFDDQQLDRMRRQQATVFRAFDSTANPPKQLQITSPSQSPTMSTRRSHVAVITVPPFIEHASVCAAPVAYGGELSAAAAAFINDIPTRNTEHNPFAASQRNTFARGTFPLLLHNNHILKQQQPNHVVVDRCRQQQNGNTSSGSNSSIITAVNVTNGSAPNKSSLKQRRVHFSDEQRKSSPHDRISGNASDGNFSHVPKNIDFAQQFYAKQQLPAAAAVKMPFAQTTFMHQQQQMNGKQFSPAVRRQQRAATVVLTQPQRAESFDVQLVLEQQEWYHGTVDRDEARTLLMHCKDGSYLVRSTEATEFRCDKTFPTNPVKQGDMMNGASANGFNNPQRGLISTEDDTDERLLSSLSNTTTSNNSSSNDDSVAAPASSVMAAEQQQPWPYELVVKAYGLAYHVPIEVLPDGLFRLSNSQFAFVRVPHLVDFYRNEPLPLPPPPPPLSLPSVYQNGNGLNKQQRNTVDAIAANKQKNNLFMQQPPTTSLNLLYPVKQSVL